MTRVTFLLIVLSLAVPAQVREEIPDYIILTVTTLQPGAFQDYAALQRELVPTRKKINAWYGQYNQLFGAQAQVSIAPTSLADYDQTPSRFAAAMGEAGMSRFQSRVGNSVAGNQRYLLRTNKELRISDAARQELPILVLSRVRVTAGRDAEFQDYIKTTVIPAFRKAGVRRYSIARVYAGAGVNDYFSFRAHAKVADTDVPPAAPKPGLSTFIDRTILRLNRDTSFAGR